MVAEVAVERGCIHSVKKDIVWTEEITAFYTLYPNSCILMDVFCGTRLPPFTKAEEQKYLPGRIHSGVSWIHIALGCRV